jgi:hypothetical protein
MRVVAKNLEVAQEPTAAATLEAVKKDQTAGMTNSILQLPAWRQPVCACREPRISRSW